MKTSSTYCGPKQSADASAEPNRVAEAAHLRGVDDGGAPHGGEVLRTDSDRSARDAVDRALARAEVLRDRRRGRRGRGATVEAEGCRCRRVRRRRSDAVDERRGRATDRKG